MEFGFETPGTLAIKKKKTKKKKKKKGSKKAAPYFYNSPPTCVETLGNLAIPAPPSTREGPGPNTATTNYHQTTRNA